MLRRAAWRWVLFSVLVSRARLSVSEMVSAVLYFFFRSPSWGWIAATFLREATAFLLLRAPTHARPMFALTLCILELVNCAYDRARGGIATLLFNPRCQLGHVARTLLISMSVAHIQFGC